MVRISADRIVPGSYQYWRFSFDYFLETVTMLGLHQVELWAAAPHMCLDTASLCDIRDIHTRISARGISVYCITPEQVNYPVNLAAAEDSLRQYSINNFRRAIDAACELECPNILTTAGTGYFDRPRDEAWKRSTDSLYQLASYAKSCGVRLLLETLTPMSSNVLNTPLQQHNMIAEMPENSMWPILDIGQMVNMNQTLDDYLSIHGSSLAHVHLHDSHPAIHMALGDGDLPLEDYLTQLESNGYSGKYSFEFNDVRYRFDPRGADLRSIKWLQDRNIIF